MADTQKIRQVHFDLRREDRFYDNVGITITVLLAGEIKLPHGAAHDVTIDISEGGLRFYDEWGLPENASLEMTLRPVDGGNPIIHFGQVRWKARALDREGFEIGVKFTGASPEDREVWLAYVAARRNRKTTARVVRIALEP